MPTPQTASWRGDATTIGLVGLAHGTSHFFHLLLPPLFPLFITEFGLSYAELGLLVSMFFVISGIGQALAGFLVDKVGARPVLLLAMCCFAAAACVASLASGYHGLMAAAMLAGLGNAPFHPADFTILNKRVSPARLGHAFSVHGITGNLGWAAAPLFLGGLTAPTGSWRIATASAGVWALVVLLLLVWQREAIDDRAACAAARHAAPAPVGEHPLAFLRLPAVWLCFSFFFWSTAALAAIQSFAGPALQSLYGLRLELTSFVVTGFMLAGAAGMVAGGFLVHQAERLERTIALCLLAAAAMLVLVGSGWLPGGLAMVLASVAGFGIGLAGPSRDMLIKRATPPGATGRVYGTVYSGLDVGFALAAPVFGALMDRQLPSMVFIGAALALVGGVLSAALVGAGVERRRSAAAGAAA
ncbi:MAG TPA: MFS transporter [Ideonella sp.]|nr:MFS transporter [Ideonella sp.]